MESFDADGGFEVRGHVVFDVARLHSVRDPAKDTASILSNRGIYFQVFFCKKLVISLK